MRPFAASPAATFAAGSLLGLVALAYAPSAHAQTTTPMTTTSIQCPAGWTVSRENSPRAAEFSTGTVGIDQPIGLRDCLCGEVIRIDNIVPMPGTGAQYIQYWIGNNAMTCQTSTNRMPPSTGIQTCFQITDPNVPQNTPATQTGFTVRIPVRDILAPNASASCATPTFGTSQTVYLSLLYTGTSDPSPVQTCTVTYNVVPPVALSAPTSTAQESAVAVSWTVGTTSTGDDSGTTSAIPANVAGYYVLQFPPPANPVFDGGCDGFSAGTDAAIDTSTGIDATPDAAVDASGDADLDATTDAPTTDITSGTDAVADTASGTDTGTGGGGTCGSPPTIDPNDPNQFNLYAVTTLLPVATTMQRVTPLTNGTRYQFAVVVQDTAGNRAISPWSACVTPQPVTDFWEQYRNRGGTVSPQLCSVRTAGAGVSWRAAFVALFAAGAGLGLLVRRRRRRRARAGDPGALPTTDDSHARRDGDVDGGAS